MTFTFIFRNLQVNAFDGDLVPVLLQPFVVHDTVVFNLHLVHVDQVAMDSPPFSSDHRTTKILCGWIWHEQHCETTMQLDNWLLLCLKQQQLF